ncbi:enoyl-CoA hydratase/isomerase family protein [Roseateles sp. BYS180W]|uniref:Enoyl-CoA hydratase/isomerase family protein n=1 Tax=Roseateles rivi TaxID=3299028 RepID=A0ABW7FVF9_9BURK
MSDKLLPPLCSNGEVLARVQGVVGLITLNRPQALNALSLAMVRDITTLLLHWGSCPQVQAVVFIGQGREGKAPAFCAGGDIRFFHQAALAQDPRLEDFFTEEYRLNHLIHEYTKPTIALMDGVAMGGGMGLAQGCKLRVVSDQSRLAMPETHIGLFPDVGGGYFLSRCPGHAGQWLALTGQVLGAGDAIELGLADVYVPQGEMPGLLAALHEGEQNSAERVVATVMERVDLAPPLQHWVEQARINKHFSAPNVHELLHRLEADTSPWAAHTLAVLRQRSPLMLAVTLEQLRRARGQGLAQELRMERDMVHHCFHARPGAASETVEGIRALAVDKDHAPRWNPATSDEVHEAQVAVFFQSPWATHEHPLRDLS